MNTRDIGNRCEEYAKKYLEENGMQIIKSNFYCREGEIDIVARDGEYIVFVEVKARKNTLFGSPCESVTKAKQKKLMMAAYKYLEQKECEVAIRFDVVEILYRRCGEKIYVVDINYIKNAFEEN